MQLLCSSLQLELCDSLPSPASVIEVKYHSIKTIKSMASCCECSDEPSGSCATELVTCIIAVPTRSWDMAVSLDFISEHTVFAYGVQARALT
jgi:hypothetical protein